MQYDSKITILMLVHNRQYFLNRVCEYYSDLIKNYKIRINIVDSSDIKWNDCHLFPEFEYTYYGPAKNIEKILLGLESITTEYALLIPDDDFYIKNSILTCVDFLVNNPEYSAAHGEILRLDSFHGKLTPSGYWKNQYINHSHNDFKFNTASERVMSFFDIENFMMLNHSVVKTKPMLESVKLRLEKKYRHLTAARFSDVQFSIMQLIEGNIKILPIVYAIRDNDRMRSRGTVPNELSPEIEFDDIVKEILAYGEPYAKMISVKDDISESSASFVLGIAIQKLISGRKMFKVNDNKIRNGSFPSITGAFDNDIKEVMEKVIKYKHVIPKFQSKKSISRYILDVIKRMLRRK